MTQGNAALVFRKRSKLPCIFQDERADCGYACIAMVSHFWGHRLDLLSIKRMHGSSQRGMTLLDIHQILERLGFMTRALRLPLEALQHVKCPAILHWDLNHFVVLKKVTKKYVIIHDPANGIRRCSFEQASQSFTGIVLEVEQSNDFKAIRQTNKLTLLQLAHTMHGMRTFMLLLICVSLSIECINLLHPLFLQYVTDNVVGLGEKSNLYVIAVGFVIVTAIHGCIEYFRGNMLIYLTNHVTEQFASNVVRHILKLPLAFFEKRHKGDIQSRFQSIDDIQKKISVDFVNAVLDGFLLLVNGIVMLMYSRVLTLIVFLVLCVSLCIRFASYQSLKKHSEASIVQHARASTVFLETLHGIIPIKAFLKENTRFFRWRNEYISALNADIQVSSMQSIYRVLEQLLSRLEHILVVCVGASLVLANRFSVGMLMAFLSYRLLFLHKTASLMQHVFNYKLITIQLNRLGDILFQTPEITHSNTRSIGEIKGDLTLQNVSFQYDENSKPILKHIHLSIAAGEKVAIIGPSGCGKTTLLKLMMGLLEQTEGDIYLDGFAIRDFGLRNYRAFTASVMQEDTLLSGSILDNIVFFEDHIDLEYVYQVAKLACIHDTIRQFPMGYETLIGDMGSTLSGGQKQRILLARALYKRPKLLFLDEATSHLDVQSERSINRALKALAMTQIIIAHRNETIQMADRIIDLRVLNETETGLRPIT